ncbi:MAG: tRNA 4-thiouridine(8) synthase ThiI [Termitinemataceae bacterium]|nr:MAG: tRNA 4-thiouridine(8) synthase ThiI [Termitinemataceae bacterium]
MAYNDVLYLLKIGELILKGGNRKEFERILRRNLATMLKGSGAQINDTNGRIYVRCGEDVITKVEDVLNHLCGITAYARAYSTEKNIESILQKITELAKQITSCASAEKTLSRCGGGTQTSIVVKTFKVDARRTDKSFPFDSYKICCAAGDAITRALPHLKVSLYAPDITFSVEIREKAYIYAGQNKGLRGLPVGSAARGMLLLSGGIDSPAAGFLMALRGMKINAVYFHSYPYTTDEARCKVIELANIVGRYTMGINLNIVSLTDVQLKIKDASPPEWSTILLRMAMMEIASAIAKIQKCKCLITGESLSQVASQTIENITCTQSKATLPVMRPLIGLDKESITDIARKIGTYETSILPYPDCCVLFSPPHPVLRAKIDEATELYNGLQLGSLIREAIDTRTVQKCAYSCC